MSLTSKILVIGDLHAPYQNKKAYNKILDNIKGKHYTHIIQIGDLLDNYVFSKYPRNINITPDKEIRQGLKSARQFWKTLKRMNPKAKCYQLLGNHDIRIAKRITEKLPELQSLFDYRDLYKFEGVTTLKSDRDYLEIDNIIFCHGWLSQSLAHAKHFNKCTVHGHRHRPTIEVEGRLWSMDVGHIGDEKQLPLQYTSSTVTKWRMAYGEIINGQPKLNLL